MATVSGKFPKRDFLVVLVGGKHCKFKNNDVPSGSDHIGGVGRVIFQRNTGKGATYRERLSRKTPCPVCGLEMVVDSMTAHCR